MSSSSAAINSDAAMVQGRPLSSGDNEQAVLDGMKGMHLSGNGNSSHPTAGMSETAAKQSNKHNNADGDHDSGVDENTQHPAGESPTKKMGSGGAATRIPKKTPPVSPTKPPTRSRAPGAIGAGRVPRSKSVPKPFTSWATPPSTSDSAKKVPMNKIKVGMSQSPNIKQVRSKIGSLANTTHRAGGGDIRIEHRKLDWKREGKTDALNTSYKPGGGDKKIENRKLEWGVNKGSKVGSMANAKHRAGGGNVKNGKLSPDRKWKSTGNVGHERKPFWERLSHSKDKDPVSKRPMAASLGASMSRSKRKVKEKGKDDGTEEKTEDEEQLSIKDDPTDDDNNNDKSNKENEDTKSESTKKGDDDDNDDNNVDDDKTIDETGSGHEIPSVLENSLHEDGIREVEKHGNSQITFHIRGRSVALRIPRNLRDSWDPDAKLEKPNIGFDVEWVYGYRGKDASGGRNIYQLPTGEMVYHVAAVAILYNLESHTQRHYMGHTNDIECMNVHPGSLALVATGQAEGHDHVNCTIQKPHVQVWNYETLELAFIVGLEDEFDTGVASVAFSETSQSGYSLLAAIERGTEGVAYLHVWYGIEKGKPKKIGKEIASQTDQVTSLHFYPGRQNVLISTGKGHLNVWTLTKKKDGNEGETELNKKQGLFTRKIPRPTSVTCAAFAKGNAEFLSGDSEGNVMVWKGIRVVRVLKGAHQGPVGDICVIEEDGSFVSGGEKDASLIVFNSEYELIGAGAILTPQVGGVRALLKRKFTSADGILFFHLIVGTTLNCIVDVTFSVTPDTTDIQEFEQEILVQGHPGTIYGLTSSLEDQFVSSGEGGSVILWDAAARKSKWSHVLHGEIVNCVAVSTVNGKVAVGTENGILYIGLLEPPGDSNGSGGNSTFKSHHTVSDDGISALSFSPDGTMLAIGSQDSIIYIMQETHKDESDLVKITGHTAGVSHLDWANDNTSLRSNSIDYELLYWKINSVEGKEEIQGEQITKGREIDQLDSTWATYNCTLTFETLGAWPEQADGTDINSCDASNGTLAVSNDFGTVRVYKYPSNQTNAEYLELLGHSAHVTGIAFLQDHGRLISAGGRESSIIQRAPITALT